MKSELSSEAVRDLLREEMRRLGSKGGKATFKKHGKEHFTTIGKRGRKTQRKLKKV